MQDLVAVGVADPGHERLVAQQVLEFARMASDPLAPDLEGQRRVVGVGSLLGRAESRARAGRRRPGRGRSCPSGSGRGSGPPAARRRPAARRPRASRRPHRAARAVARPEPEDDRGLGRQLVAGRRQLEPAGQHRVAGDRVALELDEQELAAPADGRRPAGRRARPARPACPGPRAGPGASADVIGRPARAAWRASATTVRSGNSGTARRL